MERSVCGATCEACGATSYPRHAVCPQCGGRKFTDLEIGGEATVLTYTDVYALAVDFETRYLRLAMVEFDSGLRATGQLLDDDPRIGKRVRTDVGVVRRPGDEKIEGLQFYPI